MRRTHALALSLVLLAFAGTRAPAGEDAAAGLAALERSHAEAPGSYPEKFAAVKAAYEAFAKENAGTDEGLSALLFLLRNTWWEKQAGTMNESAGKLLAEILDGYAESPRLGELVEMQYVFSAAQRAELFPKLLASSPHAAVKAEALFALGVADLRSADAAARDRGRARLAELKERFGDVRRRGLTPYGECADAHLAPHAAADLAIGKTAPEITGHDLDGKELRLSDFRGKVVVRDFWGDW